MRTPTWLLAALPLLGAACDGGGEPGADLVDDGSVEAVVSEEIATVVHVSAETMGEATVYVEYGLDTTYGRVTPVTDAASAHEAVLLGLQSETTYHYRVVAKSGDASVDGEDHTFTTGPIPESIPPFFVLDPEVEGTWGDFSLVTGQALQADVGGVFVLDDEGAVVWYEEAAYVLWAELTDEGDVVYLAPGETAADNYLMRLSLDGRTRETFVVPSVHHSGTFVPGLLAAVLAADVREHEGEVIAGDAIVEVAEDGTATTIWSAWDTLPIERHEGWDADAGGAKDWTHANGLFYDATDDTYLLSLYYLETILKIDRGGRIVWQFGGSASDFAFAEGEEPGHLHAPELLPDGRLAFFDNGFDGGSAVVVYSLDPEGGTATRDVVMQIESGRVATVLGEVEALPDGSWFTGWGDMRQYAVLGPDGSVLWRVEAAEIGLVVGQGERVESLYF